MPGGLTCAETIINVALGPRRRVWIGEAELRVVSLELRTRMWNKKRGRLRIDLRRIEC